MSLVPTFRKSFFKLSTFSRPKKILASHLFFFGEFGWWDVVFRGYKMPYLLSFLPNFTLFLLDFTLFLLVANKTQVRIRYIMRTCQKAGEK